MNTIKNIVSDLDCSEKYMEFCMEINIPVRREICVAIRYVEFYEESGRNSHKCGICGYQTKIRRIDK